MHPRNRIFQCMSLLQAYNGAEPLSQYLQSEFRTNKQYGSKDRREIRDLLYAFFRLGKLSFNDLEDRLLHSIYVTEGVKSKYLEGTELVAYPDLASQNDRLKHIKEHLQLKEDLFENSLVFSQQIELNSLTESILQKPLVYAHIHGNDNEFIEILHKNSIAYNYVDGYFEFEPQAQINQLKLPKNLLLQIQDKSSFSTNNHLPNQAISTIWDACAGAGGKSLMLLKKYSKAYILASDVRSKSLINLVNRLAKNYSTRINTALIDASRELPKNKFEMVLADVPCSGSGTWSRTPEYLYYFDAKSVEAYSNKQYTIANNCLKAVQDKGYFVYITCSVFKEENESVVEKLLHNNTDFELQSMDIIEGFKSKADTMFVTVLKRK